MSVRALQASQLASRGKGIRREPWLAPVSMSRGYDGAAPRRCQWIAGEPGGDDSCKCGASAIQGSAYCEPHHARAYRVGGAE